MRLIGTVIKKLNEFLDDPPPYAILSYTWGDKEVTLQDLNNFHEISPDNSASLFVF
jgi:hypothetical protein